MNTHYVGTELALFAQAHTWKSYVARLLRPWLGRRVLDVGAGIGGNIPTLFTDPVTEFVAMEPDAELARQIRNASRVITGMMQTLDAAEKFDAILYLDVLEHIADDAAELARAARHLVPGGRLIVLVPAHEFLFDAAIGHYRRYNRASLCRVRPANARLEQLQLLDSVGLFASLANKLVLRSANPSPGQIRLWDGTFVPVSRVLDRLIGYRVGKSVLAIWSVP